MKKINGEKNFRWEKVRYTAALRFGEILESNNLLQDRISLKFEGELTSEVEAFDEKQALKGTLYLNNTAYPNTIVIEYIDSKKLVTFWPDSQNPDAQDSYTGPLVSSAMNNEPWPIEKVATLMHEEFKKNPGVCPATLMSKIYCEEVAGKKAAGYSAEIKKVSLSIQKDFHEKITEKDKTIKVKSRKIQTQDIKLKDLENENKSLSDTLMAAEASKFKSDTLKSTGHIVKLSDKVVLSSVEKDVLYGKSYCTVLHLKDNSKRYMKTATFDKDLKITTKAEELVGKSVRLSTWDPIITPGKWSSQGYFRGIYEIN